MHVYESYISECLLYKDKHVISMNKLKITEIIHSNPIRILRKLFVDCFLFHV